MEIINLNWDSDFFKMNIGRLIVEDIELFDLNKFIFLAKDFDLVYVFCVDEIIGLKRVDIKETFLLKDFGTNDDLFLFQNIDCFSKENHSYEELLNLALQSGIYSRFKIDPKFKNHEYENLYTEWLNKSIEKKIAIDIIIKIIDDKIVGFTTLNKKTDSMAEIGLIAVDSQYRGRGVARELMKSTITRAYKLDFAHLQVATQHNNKPAVNLYKSLGFQSRTKTNIYHYWNL